MNQPTQTAADCPRCGFGTDAMSSGVCPLCQHEKQSLTHLGLSNSIGVTGARNEGRGARVLVGMGALVLVLIASFWAIVRAANQRLDRAVERIERASR